MVLLVITLAGFVVWVTATPFMSDTSKNPEITDGERDTVKDLAKLFEDRRVATERELEQMRERGQIECDVPIESIGAEEAPASTGMPGLPPNAPSPVASQDPD